MAKAIRAAAPKAAKPAAPKPTKGSAPLYAATDEAPAHIPASTTFAAEGRLGGATARSIPAATHDIIPASAAGSARPAGPTFKVRALQTGYIHDKRYRVGDVFSCTELEFSAKWMERVDAKTPERITTGQKVLDDAHDETIAERARAAGPAKDVI